jgi:hypothetical protein
VVLRLAEQVNLHQLIRSFSAVLKT